MSKHVLDRPKVVTNEMLRRAIALKRKKIPRAASLTLQRRRRTGLTPMRLRYYLQMERRPEM